MQNSSRLKRYKNYKNRLSLAKVIVKYKMSRFYGPLCSIIVIISFLDITVQQSTRSQNLLHTMRSLFLRWKSTSRSSIKKRKVVIVTLIDILFS